MMAQSRRADRDTASNNIKQGETPMGYDLTLSTSDGHTLGAYAAAPEGTAKAGMVIIQEIFGVQ